MPEKYYEVRWHARAGQGAKSASQFLAEALLDAGKYSTAFPEYGAERSGAPMKAFNRIADVPIRIRSNVQTPDVVVLFDDTMLSNKDIITGIKENTMLLINTTKSLERVRETTGFKGKLGIVKATNIALDEIKRNIPSTVMVGALVKMTDLVPISTIKDKVNNEFVGKFSDQVVKGNLNAVERGYQEVQIDG